MNLPMSETNIFIADDIPSLNKGEMAILQGMVETFEDINIDNLFLLSMNPSIDRIRYDTKIQIVDGTRLPITIYEKSKIKFFCKTLLNFIKLPFYYIIKKMFSYNLLRPVKIKEIDNFLISNIIIMGHNGVLTCMQSLLLKIPLIIYGKFLGKKIVIYAASIENMGKPRNEKIAKILLNMCDLITIREEISYNYLISIGVDINKTFLTADTAFLLKPSTKSVGCEILKKEGDLLKCPVKVGITTSQVMFRHSFPEITDMKIKYLAYLDEMAKIIDSVIKSKDATVIFIPHCIGPGKDSDDRLVAKDIFDKVQNKNRFKIIYNEYSASELKSVIGEMDFFIGERTHSLIGATSMHVPSIAITFPTDTRTHGIIGRMLGQQDNIYNIETLSVDSFIEQFEKSWSNKEEIQKTLLEKIPVVQQSAFQNGIKLKDLIMR